MAVHWKWRDFLCYVGQYDIMISAKNDGLKYKNKTQVAILIGLSEYLNINMRH